MKSKSGFTLFELLIMIIIIAIGIITIILALNNGMMFMQKTRERTIALNLAREGIEAVYQIRDTNRSRRAGQKDKCRLKKDPLNTTQDCDQDPWIMSGYYILMISTTGGQEYFILSGPYLTGPDLSYGIKDSDLTYSLCQDPDNNSRYSCPDSQHTSSEGVFFRTIRGVGLFNKTVSQSGGQEILCEIGSDSNCGNPTAKEFRFCSQVSYIGKGKGQVELCGIISNFQN